MSSPPPPPPPIGLGEATPAVRNGDLTRTWIAIIAFGWIFAFFAYSAVWSASVQVGIGTWWLGPRSQPTPFFVRAIPFLLPLSMPAALLLYRLRQPALISLATAAATGLIALPDFGRTVGLGIAEIVISTALVVISVAAHLGRIRVRS